MILSTTLHTGTHTRTLHAFITIRFSMYSHDLWFRNWFGPFRHLRLLPFVPRFLSVCVAYSGTHSPPAIPHRVAMQMKIFPLVFSGLFKILLLSHKAYIIIFGIQFMCCSRCTVLYCIILYNIQTHIVQNNSEASNEWRVQQHCDILVHVEYGPGIYMHGIMCYCICTIGTYTHT